MGVSKNKSKWKAQILYNKKLIHLGTESTPELAYALYLKFKKEYNI